MNEQNNIRKNITELEIPVSDNDDFSFFEIKNLKELLLDTLQDCGIPEEHVALTATNEKRARFKVKYTPNSRLHTQVKIKIDIPCHFLEIFEQNPEQYSFLKVQNLIKKNLVNAYGESIYEYFSSSTFFNNHTTYPLVVNQTQRVMTNQFSNEDEFISKFTSCIMGTEESEETRNSMKICIDNFCFLNFSSETLSWVKHDKKTREFYRDIQELRNLIVPPLYVLEAMEDNAETNSIIINHLTRWGYQPAIIRGEGFKKNMNTWPSEIENKALNPFLFSHEAVLCKNNMVVDFCALAHGEETPIWIGPKFLWKSYWDTTKIIPLEDYQEEQLHIHVEEKLTITRSL